MGAAATNGAARLRLRLRRRGQRLSISGVTTRPVCILLYLLAAIPLLLLSSSATGGVHALSMRRPSIRLRGVDKPGRSNGRAGVGRELFRGYSSYSAAAAAMCSKKSAAASPSASSSKISPLFLASHNGGGGGGGADSISGSSMQTDTTEETSRSSMKKRMTFLRQSVLPRLVFFVTLFLAGYRIGVNTGGSYVIDSTTATVRRSTRRFPLLSAALVFFIARDLWRSVPPWAKPRLVKRAVQDIGILFGRSSNAAAAAEEGGKTGEDADDIADIDTLLGKLSTVLNVVRTKVSGESMEDFNLNSSFLAQLQLTKQIKSQSAKSRDDIYASAGATLTPDDLKDLPQGLEFADWAYDEDPSGKPLKELLREQGYALLKHDKTAVPGYLGHYIAISTDPREKKAIIGVKGTSSLEDLITDMCGAAVSYELSEPFVFRGNTTIRAHDGVLISSRRLADDLEPLVRDLLLPQGYKIQIYGHSLGAAGATLLSIFLRSRIPMLRLDDKSLRVFAFASPPNLDLGSALACRPFVTTIVNNCDVIPRCNVSPLQVNIEVLKVINDKLKEKGLKMSGIKSCAALLRKLQEGEDGEMLLSAEELTNAINSGIEKVGLEDEDHLYVGGDVVLMYDLWENEVDKNVERKEDDNDEKDSEECAEKAVITDGTARALRYIELGEGTRLIDDHMAVSYRLGLRTIVSPQNETNVWE